MAEIAIPLIALGGMYIFSNYKDNKEGYENAGLQTNYLPGNNPSINYPSMSKINKNNTKIYKNPNQSTDRFYNESVYNQVEKTQNNFSACNNVGGGTSNVKSLTGESINKSNFKHNNMVPFFGAKIKGSTNDGLVESRLDNMQGSGSQLIKKVEQAPLFQPLNNLQYANGAPNASDFIQSRVNPSMKMSNVLPWEQVLVAPGLGKGYSSDGGKSGPEIGFGAGFNSGMEDRNSWLPKTVDELRVDTNPKMSYSLSGHQGPADARNKEYANVKQQGKVEKYTPDTYYSVGPERWFTTTGLEKGQKSRGIEMLHDQNRTTTNCEYYGGGARNNEATYVTSECNETRRPVLSANDIPAPNFIARGYNLEKDSYKLLPNSRSTTENTEYVGPIRGMLKSIVAPIFDILRPVRKENIIDSIRQSGNMQNNVTGHTIWNPADRTKTTIKETTLAPSQLNVQGQDGVYNGGYLVSEQQSIQNQRDTTTCNYTGNSNLVNGVGSQISYEAEYRQRNNVNKVTTAYTTGGCNQIFNHQENVLLKNDTNRINNRIGHVQRVVSMPPNSDTYGKINVPQYLEHNQNCNRNSSDILTAFKNNPYTQSLHSY